MITTRISRPLSKKVHLFFLFQPDDICFTLQKTRWKENIPGSPVCLSVCRSVGRSVNRQVTKREQSAMISCQRKNWAFIPYSEVPWRSPTPWFFSPVRLILFFHHPITDLTDQSNIHLFFLPCPCFPLELDCLTFRVCVVLLILSFSSQKKKKKVFLIPHPFTLVPDHHPKKTSKKKTNNRGRGLFVYTTRKLVAFWNSK